MSSEFAERVNISLWEKEKDAFTVQDINKNLLEYNNRMISQEITNIRLWIGSHTNDIRFNITAAEINDIVLKLSWLEEFNSNISFRHQIINFLMRKLVHMNRELRSEVKICAIFLNELKKKLPQNSDAVKILWTRQTNLVSITLTDSIISEEYRDFVKLFVDEAPGKALSKH